MIQIEEDLFMSSAFNKFVNLSFNQYLLLGEEPILLHAGSFDYAAVCLKR